MDSIDENAVASDVFVELEDGAKLGSDDTQDEIQSKGKKHAPKRMLSLAPMHVLPRTASSSLSSATDASKRLEAAEAIANQVDIEPFSPTIEDWKDIHSCSYHKPKKPMKKSILEIITPLFKSPLSYTNNNKKGGTMKRNVATNSLDRIKVNMFQFTNTKTYGILFMIATFYALFVDDFRVLIFEKSADETLMYILLVVFIMFLFELLM